MCVMHGSLIILDLFIINQMFESVNKNYISKVSKGAILCMAPSLIPLDTKNPLAWTITSAVFILHYLHGNWIEHHLRSTSSSI